MYNNEQNNKPVQGDYRGFKLTTTVIKNDGVSFDTKTIATNGSGVEFERRSLETVTSVERMQNAIDSYLRNKKQK